MRAAVTRNKSNNKTTTTMTIQLAIEMANKKGFTVSFNEFNWAYEFTKKNHTLFFMPNGMKNTPENRIMTIGVSINGQNFFKPNLKQAIQLFDEWAK